jgi:hypothetical protein
MEFKKLLVSFSGVAVAFALVQPAMAQSKAEKREERKAERQQDEKKGNSGKQHETAKPDTKPLVHTFEVKQGGTGPGSKPFGSVNVTINPDGTWNYSGNVGKDPQWELSGCAFTVVLGVKSSEGTVVAFRHDSKLEKENPASYSWEKQGKNNTLKDNFKSFAKDHDWYGSWNCIGLPQQGSNSGSGGGGPSAGAVVSDVVGVLGTILAFF